MTDFAPRVITSQKRKKSLGKFIKENKPPIIDAMIDGNVLYCPVDTGEMSGFAKLKKKKVNVMLTSKDYLARCFDEYMSHAQDPTGTGFQLFSKSWIKQFDYMTVDLDFTKKEPSETTCDHLQPIWKEFKRRKIASD